MSSASTSAALYAIVTAPKSGSKARPNDAKELRHHNKNGKGFLNPWDSYVERSVLEMGRMMSGRYMAGKMKSPNTTPPTVTVRKPDLLPTRETPELRATWLGHACYYVEFPGGLRVLFDPVFDERCSPFTFIGPKRYTDAPCQVENLPFIDAVVISHNHYDHLSHPTITKIQKKFPNVHFFAPLGNKAWFTDCGLHNMTELDWWETRTFTLSADETKSSEMTTHEDKEGTIKTSSMQQDIEASISCLPAQHTSARTPFDKAQTLWGSWSVESGGKKVWFGGDTGYRAVPDLPDDEFDYDDKYSHLPVCPAFSEIGELRGPFDLGLIPIGAYDPRFIMSPMHANPYDSVNIFVDTKCARAMGIHWGTWVLTEEDVLEPRTLLKKALAWKGLPEEGVFDTCDIGESREF
ncbi:hypothetical protein AAFC00_006776 [Neodothiora populina]|uniref:Metallo-beta-lactamase domain-containing protein n=1 Tax=Neodothiora populina TaxID=2781224 RepID=A0ABR3PBD9_9PEZI